MLPRLTLLFLMLRGGYTNRPPGTWTSSIRATMLCLRCTKNADTPEKPGGSLRGDTRHHMLVLKKNFSQLSCSSG